MTGPYDVSIHAVSRHVKVLAELDALIAAL